MMQKLMAELFKKDVRTINEHIDNIFAEGCLVELRSQDDEASGKVVLGIRQERVDRIATVVRDVVLLNQVVKRHAAFSDDPEELIDRSTTNERYAENENGKFLHGNLLEGGSYQQKAHCSSVCVRLQTGGLRATSKTIVPETITGAELAQLAVRRYEGPVCLVSTPEELDRARHEMSQEQVVGMDTETQPTFRKGQVYLPSLVQVATSRAVYLFQLKRMDFTGLLKELLESPLIAKAGIGLSHDFAKLKDCFPFEEKNVVDLSAIARTQGMKQTGVRNLAALFLGFRVTKGQSTTNWARAELTQNQIIYAATDAWVCRELHLCFQERGFLG